MIQKVRVYGDQNIVDLAIQEYGSVEGLVALASRNNLAVDQDPAGSEITIETNEVVNQQTRTFFKNNGLVVATGRV